MGGVKLSSGGLSLESPCAGASPPYLVLPGEIMPDWIKRMIKRFGKLGVLDLCIDCEEFVLGPRTHKQGTYKDHVVIRIEVR